MRTSVVRVILAVLVAAALAAAAVQYVRRSRGTPLDLVSVLKQEKPPVSGKAAGREIVWAQNQSGKQVRIGDVVYKVLPAAPPTELRYTVDVPPEARLAFAVAISPDAYEKPGVEFVVKADRGKGEEVVWSEVLNPLQNPKHRGWMPMEVDLSKFAGRGRTLVFETRGYDKEDDPRRAFWGAPVIEAPRRQAPLTIVYLVDTLRADHTTVYGYARDTTPNLKAFAQDAVVFEKAIAHASWTKPSVASLMTSLLPGRHRAVQLRDKLDDGHWTMAELLQAKGFTTGAVIANSVIYSAGINFEQGFDYFAGMHGAEDRPSKIVEAAPVVDEALRWLDTRKGMDTFLYVHQMDPHVPYTPPPPFDRKFTPHPTPDHPGIDPRTDYKEPADRDRLIAQYDGEIAYGDQEFGRFVRELKARGLYERALIVFMGDHGEEFFDHGKWLHGRSVFDELVHIPLIVKFPQNERAGTRFPTQVQEVDILPTVLVAMDLEAPTFHGLPLQASLNGKVKERGAVSEISHRGIVAYGMRTDHDKYIQRFSPEEDELYFDLQKDPGEKSSQLEGGRERVRTLKANLQEAMVTNPFQNFLKVVGPGTYDLYLRTGGWIEGLQTTGLGTQERAVLEGNKRKLSLFLTPKKDQPREINFTVRPIGAPVYVLGTKDGRPLQPSDILIAEQGIAPLAIPARLPEVEPVGEDEAPGRDNIFAPPKDPRPGVHLWLKMLEGRSVTDIDKAKCEELKALGYVSQC